MYHFLPTLLVRYGAKAFACAGAKSKDRNVYLLHLLVVNVVSRQTLIMLTTLLSVNTGTQARQTFER